MAGILDCSCRRGALAFPRFDLWWQQSVPHRNYYPFGGPVRVNAEYRVGPRPWLRCITRVHINAAVSSEFRRHGSTTSKEVVTGDAAAVVGAARVRHGVRAERCHEFDVIVAEAHIAFPAISSAVQP